MLASNRKHKVTGRTKIETNSTIHKNGTKYQGVLLGSKEEGNLYLMY